jgi:hypothetical protein
MGEEAEGIDRQRVGRLALFQRRDFGFLLPPFA